MKTHYPYKIVHINLKEQVTMPELETGSHGYYLVFWWSNFALGHFLLDSGVKLSHNEYYRKLTQAILPAVSFYLGKEPDLISDWQQLLRKHQIEKWNSWMEHVLATHTHNFIPRSIPVSVIICTHRRAAHLQRCLKMLLTLTCQPDEIIVVDNAPEDDATAYVAQQFEKVVYIKEPRTGLDIARNTGIKHAKQPIIAFVDDDVTVHPHWLYRVWETFREPTIGAMTGLVIASEMNTEAQCIFEKHWSFNRGYADKLYDQSFIKATLAKGPPVWKIGAGANMAFRKSVFETTGYFNELLDAGAAGCSGDSEMWYRILMKGYIIHYNPRAIVFHEHRKELDDLKKQIFYYMRGHATAALIQQKQYRQAGYVRYLFKLFLKTYSRSVLKGFPNYHYQYSTLWQQITGALAGLAYYYRHKKRSSHTFLE